MKILQICSKSPYQPKDGGSIAMNVLTNGLIHCGNQVKVFSIQTTKHFINEKEVDAAYKKMTSYQSVFIDTSIKPLKAFLNLFSTKSYNVDRFYSKAFEKALIELLKKQEFDVIQLETLWLSPYVDVIRKFSKAKIILRSHNVEYLIWERLAADTTNPVKRAYLKLLSQRLKKYELHMLNAYDGIASITTLDADLFKSAGCKKPILHIPFGIDLVNYPVDLSKTEFPSLFHLGSMDWLPNSDAVKWFLTKVWEKMNHQYPAAKFYLAGRNMPSWLLNLNMKNTVVVGEVPNAQQFINSKSIMVVPLFSGGGMRVKIIEGMALGKCIISTSIGAEGIKYEKDKNILIADTADEFIAAIKKCFDDASFVDEIGKNARLLVEAEYDNEKISKKLSDFYQTIK